MTNESFQLQTDNSQFTIEWWIKIELNRNCKYSSFKNLQIQFFLKYFVPLYYQTLQSLQKINLLGISTSDYKKMS
jgi:hypothetical protein